MILSNDGLHTVEKIEDVYNMVSGKSIEQNNINSVTSFLHKYLYNLSMCHAYA